MDNSTVKKIVVGIIVIAFLLMFWILCVESNTVDEVIPEPTETPKIIDILLEETVIPSATETTVTVSPTNTPEPTQTPSPTPEPTLLPIPTQGKIMFTVYDEVSKWGRRGANPEVSARGGLVSMGETTLYDETLKVYLHSIAIDSRKIPWGTVFYIPELNRYFIADDDTSVKMLNVLQDRATSKGCDIWADIFICTDDRAQGLCQSTAEWGCGTVSYKIIRWGYNSILDFD